MYLGQGPACMCSTRMKCRKANWGRRRGFCFCRGEEIYGNLGVLYFSSSSSHLRLHDALGDVPGCRGLEAFEIWSATIWATGWGLILLTRPGGMYQSITTAAKHLQAPIMMPRFPNA